MDMASKKFYFMSNFFGHSRSMSTIPPHLLVAARALAGLSQGGLASISGVTRQTIIRAEKGLSIHDANRTQIINALEKNGVLFKVTAKNVVLLGPLQTEIVSLDGGVSGPTTPGNQPAPGGTLQNTRTSSSA
jgi:DNA-binding XRE family transcriptional regulator